MSPTTLGPKPAHGMLFSGSKFDIARVVGHKLASDNNEIANPEVAEIVQTLHEQLKAGERTQTQIDRYIPYIHMLWSNDPLLDRLPWRYFVLREQDVCRVEDLVDIGFEVRAMLMKSGKMSIMHKLIQYSMPYIKHNRLNFPSYADVTAIELVQMLRITMASCLGLMRENTKRPIFVLRVKIVVFFTKLIASGNSMDHYIFCSSFLSLLRIAIIEYFMVFMQQFLPAEKQMLCMRFQLDNNVDEMFRSFFAIIDVFRQSVMQTSLLDFSLINTRAHVAIEKCNRITKGKTRQDKPISSCNTISIPTADIAAAMAVPRFAHVTYARAVEGTSNLTWKTLENIERVHALIDVTILPHNIAKQQAEQVLRTFKNNSSSLYNCLWLNICVRCVCDSSKFTLNSKMRIMSSGRSFCSVCRNDTFVIPISTLGKIVKIQNVRFYYCVFCTCIHEWKATGYEFMACPFSGREVGTTSKSSVCHLCKRTTGLSKMSVLDDILGVMQIITLCVKHRPLAFQEPCIYNLFSLRNAIIHKMNRYRVSGVAITTLAP